MASCISVPSWRQVSSYQPLKLQQRSVRCLRRVLRDQADTYRETAGNVRQDPYRVYPDCGQTFVTPSSNGGNGGAKKNSRYVRCRVENCSGLTRQVMDRLVSDIKSPQVSDSAGSPRRSPAWWIGCFVRNVYLRILANSKFCNGQCSGGSHAADAATVVDGDSNVRR